MKAVVVIEFTKDEIVDFPSEWKIQGSYYDIHRLRKIMAEFVSWTKGPPADLDPFTEAKNWRVKKLLEEAIDRLQEAQGIIILAAEGMRE